jgi:phosphopantetheine--protein transferase-like protein
LSVNIGVDIVEIERIKNAISTYNDVFLTRVYTNTELDYCKNMPSRLAARFAAKEAVMKLLGIGALGMNWREIEVVHIENGPPEIQLYGKIKDKASVTGITGLSLSLSHEKKYAVACVIGNVN